VHVRLFAVIHSLAHPECFRSWRFRFFVHCVVIFLAQATVLVTGVRLPPI
jgi:hypothetical protein